MSDALDTYQYGDLPQIPSSLEESQAMMWNPHMTVHHPSTMVGEDYGYMRKGAPATTLERFLLDASPLTPGLLHANLQHGTHQHHQKPRPYQQWPTPELTRYDSPDRTSVSGNSSYATQNETRSPRTYAVTYGNPDDFIHSASPYPTTDHLGTDAFPFEYSQSHSSGNISLRDLEYEHEPEQEINVDESEIASTEMDVTYEPDPSYHPRIEIGPGAYNPDPELAISPSLQKAESVQHISFSDDSDTDYKPKPARRRPSASSNTGRPTRRRRSNVGRKAAATPATPTRITKRGVMSPISVSNKSSTHAHTIAASAQRYFPCPLAPYGCTSTFSSKNEWKRHVSTQHIKLGFWRCDLCPTTSDPHDRDTVYHNDFNRKDLFTQHLRRMHAAPPATATLGHTHRGGAHTREYPVSEDNIADHQKRCFQVLRETPVSSKCLYCEEVFEGTGSWDERMEHVGRHLEKDGKGGLGAGAGGAGGALIAKITDVEAWNRDEELERWLLSEGIVAVDAKKGWRIGDGRRRGEGGVASAGSESDA